MVSDALYTKLTLLFSGFIKAIKAMLDSFISSVCHKHSFMRSFPGVLLLREVCV
ncbi:hypothetical protein ANAPC5_01390 [Anaplasma phagocytophilum]|nr:hypothetical protein ANAPC5_01390 [Anaplasma phagocytophilum]